MLVIHSWRPGCARNCIGAFISTITRIFSVIPSEHPDSSMLDIILGVTLYSSIVSRRFLNHSSTFGLRMRDDLIPLLRALDNEGWRDTYSLPSGE